MDKWTDEQTDGVTEQTKPRIVGTDGWTDESPLRSVLINVFKKRGGGGTQLWLNAG